MRKYAILPIALAVLAAGCGSSKHATSTTTAKNAARVDESAARFVVRVQAQLKLGRFAQAWRTLHPAEKRAVTPARLASCYPRGQFPGTVTFKATKTRDVRWLVPGTTDSVDAKEVTLTAISPGQPKQTFAQHIVRAGAGWAWMLSKHYFDAARRGTC